MNNNIVSYKNLVKLTKKRSPQKITKIHVLVNPQEPQTKNLEKLLQGQSQPVIKVPLTPSPQAPTQRKAISAVSRNAVLKKRRAKQVKVRYLTPDPSPESLAKIMNLKNHAKGRILVIIGNGPSILETNLDKLKGHPLIDVMSINKPDMRVWPSRYWTFFDQSQYTRHEDLWNNYDGILFNSTSIKKQKATSMQFKNTHGKGWSRDLTKGIFIGRSSVFAGMQIALWLGHEHIYTLGCLPDGEKILTTRGMVPIDSLVEDDLVYTSEGFQSVSGYQRRHYVGELISLTTRMNNIPLRVTSEHPILVRRENQDEYIRANEVRIGDEVVFPIDMSEVNDDHSEQFWWLVGLYTAEGYLRKTGSKNKYKYATLCLGAHENDLYKKVVEIVSSEFECKVTGDQRNRPVQELIINNNQFGKFVDEHIGQGSKTKFLSGTIMRLPLSKQAAFVNGYCASDGSIFKRKRTNKSECTISTASESLAEGLQKILLRLGVISNLVRSRRLSGFDRKGTGSFGMRHHINIIGSSLTNLAKWCKWPLKTSGKKSLFGSRIIDNKLIVSVRVITRLEYCGYVNNIEVNGPHTFGSRLIMTHNCDMDANGLNGQLHFYGTNPDVDPEVRKSRFSKEAEYYDFAAETLTAEERSRFTFCSEYNKWDFVKRFNHMSHKSAVNHILDHADIEAI